MIELRGKYDGQMWVGDPTTSRSLETELVSQAAQSPGIWMENYAAGPYNILRQDHAQNISVAKE